MSGSQRPVQDGIQATLPEGSILTGYVGFLTYMDQEGVQQVMGVWPEEQLLTTSRGLAACLTDLLSTAVGQRWGTSED